MFKCFRRNKEITFNSLSTRKLRLTCFSVNLDVLEKYVNGYYSRRGVLYGEGSYELVCDERSSFRTRLILQQRAYVCGVLPALLVEVNKDKEGKLTVTVAYEDFSLLSSDSRLRSVNISTGFESTEELKQEFYKLHTLGMYDVYDLFIDFSASLRGFLQISDEEYKELLEKKTKELWVRKEGK